MLPPTARSPELAFLGFVSRNDTMFYLRCRCESRELLLARSFSRLGPNFILSFLRLCPKSPDLATRIRRTKSASFIRSHYSRSRPSWSSLVLFGPLFWPFSILDLSPLSLSRSLSPFSHAAQLFGFSESCPKKQAHNSRAHRTRPSNSSQGKSRNSLPLPTRAVSLC